MLSEPADEPELDDELALDVAASCETDGVEAGEPNVVRNHYRQLAKDALPVEPTLASAGHGLPPWTAGGRRSRRTTSRFPPPPAPCDSCASRLDFSALRSEIWLLVRTIPVIVSTASDAEHRDDHVGESAPCASAPCSPRRSSGGIKLTGRMRYSSRARPKERVNRAAVASSEVRKRPRPADLEPLTQVVLEAPRRARGSSSPDRRPRCPRSVRRPPERRSTRATSRSSSTSRAAPSASESRAAETVSLSPSIPSTGFVEAHVHQPLAGVLEGELAPLGELLGYPLDPERRDAGEQAVEPRATARLVTSPRLQ